MIVGEDQPLVREGIVHVLQDAGFEVAGAAADARALVRMARMNSSDAVIADIQMPPITLMTGRGQLTVTVAAVERHVTSIFDKLGLHQSPDQHRRGPGRPHLPADLTHAASQSARRRR